MRFWSNDVMILLIVMVGHDVEHAIASTWEYKNMKNRPSAFKISPIAAGVLTLLGAAAVPAHAASWQVGDANITLDSTFSQATNCVGIRIDSNQRYLRLVLDLTRRKPCLPVDILLLVRHQVHGPELHQQGLLC